MSRPRHGTPRSLLSRGSDGPTVFTRDQALAMAEQVQGHMTAEESTILVESGIYGSTKFASSEVLGGADSDKWRVSFAERSNGGTRQVSLTTDELDADSLRDAVIRAEASLKAQTVNAVPQESRDPLRPPGPVNPTIWSDSSTALVAADGRFPAIDAVIRAAGRHNVFAAGRLGVELGSSGIRTLAGHFEYSRTSTGSLSITARTKDGTGSGWASWIGNDWSKANVEALAERAMDIAQRSRNPVAVEPGRWTVVMTPEACGELVQQIAVGFSGMILDGRAADGGGGPFSKPGGGNKIGFKVLDERVTLSADPMDPDAGFPPYAFGGEIYQYRPVTWVERGVLKALSYPTIATAAAHGIEPFNNASALRMSGGPMSIEEMIATTERGIYVTRFSDVMPLVLKTCYLTGTTRDGTFLIEKGKITKPVKNMRFEDSPFFFLNNLEAIGPVKRVAVGSGRFVMPAMKVRDFAFTSLTDAV